MHIFSKNKQHDQWTIIERKQTFAQFTISQRCFDKHVKLKAHNATFNYTNLFSTMLSLARTNLITTLIPVTVKIVFVQVPKNEITFWPRINCPCSKSKQSKQETKTDKFIVMWTKMQIDGGMNFSSAILILFGWHVLGMLLACCQITLLTNQINLNPKWCYLAFSVHSFNLILSIQLKSMPKCAQHTRRQFNRKNAKRNSLCSFRHLSPSLSHIWSTICMETFVAAAQRSCNIRHITEPIHLANIAHSKCKTNRTMCVCFEID